MLANWDQASHRFRQIVPVAAITPEVTAPEKAAEEAPKTAV
jgi:hypothetical protein